MLSKITIAGISLFLTFIVGVVGFRYFEQPTDLFVSPNGKYRLELFGDKERPWDPFRTNRVTADILSDGIRRRGIHVHTGDWMDSSFDLTYQRLRWHNERVFGFHGDNNHEGVNEGYADSLTLTNKTEMRIAYLNARFGNNRFLVFDLEPGETQVLFAAHGVSHEYIYVDGEFENGVQVGGTGLNFSESSKKQKSELFQYCAAVVGENVVVNGLGIEGTSSWPNEIRVPAVSSCGD